MSLTGTIRKNSIMYKVAEAILTHEQINFTCPEIWKILNNDYPEITVTAVSHCITKTDSPISKICIKTPNKKGMATIYSRIPTAVMPPVVKSGYKRKSKSKKVKPIPDTVTNDQIAQSFILYIDRLRTKIKDLATAIGDMQAKNKSEIRLHAMTLKQKDNTIEKLQEELTTLRAIKKTKSRTFNMGELI